MRRRRRPAEAAAAAGGRADLLLGLELHGRLGGLLLLAVSHGGGLGLGHCCDFGWCRADELEEDVLIEEGG